MRVAVNCRSILKPRLTGIGRNTFHLLENLGRIDQANQYLLYCPQKLFDFKRRLPSFNYKNFTVKRDAFECGPGRTLGQHDVYHIPNPDFVPEHTSSVIVTVHDLIHRTYPQSHTPQTIALSEQHMQGIVARATRIICTSENTRRDLHHYYDVPKERTVVVYNGVDHSIFYPISLEEKTKAQAVLASKGIKDPYILSVGTLEPRKNLPNVLQAMANLKQANYFHGKLVVIGAGGWMMDKIELLIEQMGIKSDVVFLGYVTDEELRYFYNLAEAFVYPSFYEGFGFPIVEAFCCGCAVVTSNVSSCPEVAGDAALIVDPNDAKAIAGALARIINDQGVKSNLQAKALVRAKDFSFEATAQQTLQVYEDVYAR